MNLLWDSCRSVLITVFIVLVLGFSTIQAQSYAWAESKWSYRSYVKHTLSRFSLPKWICVSVSVCRSQSYFTLSILTALFDKLINPYSNPLPVSLFFSRAVSFSHRCFECLFNENEKKEMGKLLHLSCFTSFIFCHCITSSPGCRGFLVKMFLSASFCLTTPSSLSFLSSLSPSLFLPLSQTKWNKATLYPI